MTALDDSSPSGRPASHRRRSRRLLLIAVGLVLLAVLAVLGWTWRHPTAFEDYGGWSVGHTDRPVGETVFVGMTFPGDRADQVVSIDGADPHGLTDSTGAEFAYFLCTPASGPEGAAIGLVSEADASRQCGRLVPADDAKLATATQQLVVAITPSREGLVVLHGLDLHYADGWQHGTQHVGGDIRIRVRDPR